MQSSIKKQQTIYGMQSMQNKSNDEHESHELEFYLSSDEGEVSEIPSTKPKQQEEAKPQPTMHSIQYTHQDICDIMESIIGDMKFCRTEREIEAIFRITLTLRQEYQQYIVPNIFQVLKKQQQYSCFDILKTFDSPQRQYDVIRKIFPICDTHQQDRLIDFAIREMSHAPCFTLMMQEYFKTMHKDQREMIINWLYQYVGPNLHLKTIQSIYSLCTMREKMDIIVPFFRHALMQFEPLSIIIDTECKGYLQMRDEDFQIFIFSLPFINDIQERVPQLQYMFYNIHKRLFNLNHEYDDKAEAKREYYKCVGTKSLFSDIIFYTQDIVRMQENRARNFQSMLAQQNRATQVGIE